MNWRGVNVIKLLVRDDFCLVDGEVVPAFDWYDPHFLAHIIANGWYGEHTIVGTDRYTLDVEHEQHMRQIASEFDALFGTLLAGGWYNNHDH